MDYRAKSRRFQPAMLTVTLIMVLLLSSCASRLPKTQESLQSFTAYLDERVPQLLEHYAVPGTSIALVQDGELVWSGAYGYADLEQGLEMRVDAVYRVESISKSVSAWGIMKLVEQGRIDLDAPVQQYLGDWQLEDTPFNEQEITVRKLLNNNAGMPLGAIGRQYSPLGDVPGLRQYLSEEARLIKEPGMGFLYANTGYNLMELMVEEVTGQDFGEYMSAEVLAPLGMKTATYNWDEKFNASIPTAYNLQGEIIPLYVYPARASGGLFASVEDVARFTIAGMSGPYASGHSGLSQASVNEIHTPRVEIAGVYGVVADWYGYGHFIEALPDGRQAVWHGGQGNGWMTHFHMVPESGDAIVILTNSQRSWPLMAQILSAWAQWNGFGSVKMGIVSKGVTIMWGVTGLVTLAGIWLLIRLAVELIGGQRKFAPFSTKRLLWRTLQAGAGVAGVAALVWSAAQPYLIVSSIFPGVAEWTWRALLLLSIALILTACTPREPR